MNKYIISPITTYNEEEELFETKVGKNTPDMPLLYTAHGLSEASSRLRAQNVANFLNDITTHP